MTMKPDFTDAQIADFLRRSYFVVDGLWFVKTEEKRGFDEAMQLDEAVWEIMSKVQARKAKSLLAIKNGSLRELSRAFQLKLIAEGYDFDVEEHDGGVRLTVRVCPWYEVLKSSGRTAIAQSIAERICAREFAGWTREFDAGIEFEILKRLCVESDNCCECVMEFRQR